MSVNKQDFTIVAQCILDELVNDITGENEDWLFGKKPSDNVLHRLQRSIVPIM